MGDCGIEIQFSNTGTVEKIFKALHALHLDAVNRWMTHNTQAVIVVDGVEHVQTVTERHFLAVPPGEHTIGFYFFDKAALTASPAMQQQLNEADCKVMIEPGKITRLDYRLRSPTVMTSTLTVIGTTDA